MKKSLLLIGILLLSHNSYATPAVQPELTPEAAIERSVEQKLTTKQISSMFTSVEQKVRAAAVRVSDGEGHGSGGMIKYKDMTFILTAQHVADGALGRAYLVSNESEDDVAILIYKDPVHDMSVLYMPREFKQAKGIKWKPAERIANVGDKITYSGYPSWHSLLSFRGNVAGYEVLPDAGTQIMLQTYGWFGCSGSLIYNEKGRAAGILWGIDIQRGLPQENIVWVAPIQNLDLNLAIKALCTGLADKPKACK
tara:strand:- start:1499 stop:2257 length:759 start_codon:yes stop_codon:yes gene_type:complete